MRKYLYNIIGLFVLGIFAVSCDSAHQDVSQVVSPDNNPVATFISDFSGSTITEGDTITYSISLDKPHTASLTFSVKVTGGTADESDIEVISGTIPAFKTETEVQIIFSADDIPEESETIDLEIGLFSVAEMYVLNPSVVNPTPSLTINNYNDPDYLTVTFGWLDSHDDWDVYLYVGATGYYAAETGSDPEILAIANADADATYDLILYPWDVSASTTEYTISVGYPDQTVAFYEGTVEAASYDGSSLLTVVKSGTNYTVTHNN